MQSDLISFQDMILCLQRYWAEQGCVILQPYDMQLGAGTFHPATFLRAIGPEPWLSAFVQICRRPGDGRYGENPNRLQQYFQFQVVLKPAPATIQSLYLDSLEALGVQFTHDDIRFVEDNWESPTQGAWGLGWEVWQNGMEISQFTYFQQVGGLACSPITGELTYGLERLAMHLQHVNNVYDLIWTYQNGQPLRYGELFLNNEKEMSAYNFEHADVVVLKQQFDQAEAACKSLLADLLPLPAYEMVITASHLFNLLDARQAISVTERQQLILRIRHLSQQVAETYYQNRESAGFPLGGAVT